MTYTRVASGDPGNSGATSAVTVVNALADFAINGGHKVPATMTSPPTVTVGGSGSATAISGSSVTAPNSAVFTYLGAVMSNVGTLGSYANCYRQSSSSYAPSTAAGMGYMLNVEFECDDDDLEVIVRSEATWARGRIMVDGEYAAADFTITGTAGEYRRIRVQFGSAVSRRIRFEAQGVSFCGVAIHPTGTLWATTRDTGPVVAHVADSYALRYLPSTVQWVWGGYLYQAGFHLGWNVYPMSIGGTGFQNNNYGAGDAPYASRTTQLLAIPNLAAVVVQASINDPYFGSFSLSTVQTNINTWFSTVRAGLSNGEPIYAIGGIVANSTNYSTMATIAGYMQTACTTYSGTYIDSLGWITGNGRTDADNGSGNSCKYVGTDGVHFNEAGYAYLTQRAANALGSMYGRRA